MQDFAKLMDIVYMLFNREFVLYGFKLSFWKIFIFLAVASMIIYAIKEIFS